MLQHANSIMETWLEANRPPEHIRPELDIGWRLEGQSLFIYEIRPDWKDASIIRNMDFAKATFVKLGNHWKVYWMRADLKWHPYPHLKIAKSLDRFLKEVDDDPHFCFKG